MKTRQYPIENLGTNTSWTYNTDDTVNTTTDPRGVVTNFSYYATTGLLHQITYDVPSGQASTVPDTPDVSYTYDNLGNRTAMTDGTGSASYAYNELSQMTSETKTFAGLTGNFPINYTYNLSGGLKTMSDPQDSNRIATYNFDKVGRVTGVERALQSVIENSIHDTKFRAWGGIKEYRTSGTQSTDYAADKFTYDARLNISQYQRGTDTSGYATINYQRYADGAAKYAEQMNSPTFDRRFRYDHVGRLIQGQSGFEANGRTDMFVETPFRNNMSYNAFSETTNVNGKHWPRTITPYAPSIDGGTGRIAGVAYDAAGNITLQRMTMQYDAAGRNVHTYDPLAHPCCENNHTYDNSYDGNGWKVKGVDLSAPPTGSSNTETKYEIRSTVLGGETVGELKTFDWSSGVEKRFITPVNGVKLGARVEWTVPEGIRTYGEDGAELDTRGSDVGTENPYNTGDGGGGYPSTGGDPTNYMRCSVDGSAYDCSKLYRNFIKTPQFLTLLVMHKSKIRTAQYDYNANSDPNGTEITGGWGGTSQDGRTIVNVNVSIPDETLEQVFRGFASMTFYSRETWQTGTPAPLNPKERQKLEDNIAKINETIQKKKCKEFLEGKLGKSILADITKTLSEHQAFSGPRSTDINVVAAGIISPTEVTRLNGIIAAGVPASGSAQYELTRTVAQFFADNNGQGGRKVGGAVGNYNGNPNTAFYRSFDRVKILHETLHIATGLNDDRLATALGVDILCFSGDWQLSSAAITQALKGNGCN